ncbi:hypothetical protein [Nocardia arthritidis]|uniref:Uncharacterized protein n=1 Tax=Nocardia arthritidis TaxID=228602 RepID=A0A6G9YQS6_9NOCA|nr:hypothetical protein [Nocardia arthritidis]QIS15376.1 hypothetical protein F5544_37750 [Nocardia arthritidis]
MFAYSTPGDSVLNLFTEPPEVPGPEAIDAVAETETAPIITTHRVTYSDRLKVFIGPSEKVQNFLRPLRRLDGYDRYSVCMTRLPAPMRSLDIPATPSADRGEDQLTCMGSADELVIELRRTVDGATRRYLVGTHPDRVGVPVLTISVQRGMHQLRVHFDEVFTADEAAEILTAYYRTGEVPSQFTLRELVIR